MKYLKMAKHVQKSLMSAIFGHVFAIYGWAFQLDNVYWRFVSEMNHHWIQRDPVWKMLTNQIKYLDLVKHYLLEQIIGHADKRLGRRMAKFLR